MNLKLLVHVVGLILVAISAALGVAGAVALLYGDGDAPAFLYSALVPLVIGVVAWKTTEMERDLRVREGYAVVSLAWLAIGVVGALPFLFAGVVDSPVDALFESVSGFTTTGATIFADIESLPHGILFWRNFTQWIGGMGIIVLGIAILPYLGVGGMQLFRAEVPGPTPERLAPRITQTAKLLWLVYAGLTAAEAALFLLGGMGPFDAVTHAFTTMSTGGFSPRGASLAAFDSAYIHYVTVIFMALAGVNFALHYRAFTGRPGVYLKEPEFRFFGAVLGVALVLVLGNVVLSGHYETLGLERAFRDSLFQVVSIATTTGYVSYDYELWPLGAQLVLLLLMFMGGMSGSTGGGMKAVRLNILVRHGFAEMRKSLHPRAVVATRMGRRAIQEGVLLNVLAFVLLYLLLFAIGVLTLAFLGHDLDTAVGAAASAIGNIGPGLGEVGAVDNFHHMGPTSHLVLVFLMLVGRLEIFTVLLLFHPDLWTHTRFGGN